MESGANNWDLAFRRENGGVALLRCATPDEAAALPETVDGLPVTALGPYALCPTGHHESGEQVHIVCGPDGSKPWDNSHLRELSLPRTLQRVGRYALYQCRTLKRVRLYDGIETWGDGALLNCRSLDTVEIFRDGPDHGALAYFAGELNRELDVTVRSREGVLLRLIFPAYRETYEENGPAHHFDYTIQGAGYPYRQCFHRREINLIEYDSLWPHLRDLNDGACLRLAWWRLQYPAGLSDRAGEAYREWLQGHAGEAAERLMEERDGAGLRFLLDRTAPDRETLSRMASFARERRNPEALAVVLDEQHHRFPVPDEDRFAL